MASDRQRFRQAVAKWENLTESGDFSVPSELGKVAIISSYFTDEPLDTETGMTELMAFRTEAVELADRALAQGRKPVLAIDASRSEINDLIKDETISDMVVIGNGSLATLMLGERDYYSWTDVSDNANHLKLGKFIQRQCGGLTRATNVPLGLFGISDPKNVYAALDPAFYPKSLDDDVNKLIQPVFPTGDASYTAIKGLKYVLSSGEDRDDEHNMLTGDFITRFKEIEAIVRGDANDAQRFYVQLVKERFGFDLVKFYHENLKLCEDIFDSIHAEGMSEQKNLNSLLAQAYVIIDSQILNAPFLVNRYY